MIRGSSLMLNAAVSARADICHVQQHTVFGLFLEIHVRLGWAVATFNLISTL